MQTNVRKAITISSILTLVITAIASVCNYFAMAYSFDHELGYFDLGSITAAFAVYLPLLVPVIGIVCAVSIRKKASFHSAPAVGIPTVFTSILVGLLMVASAFFAFSAEGPLTNLEIGVVVFSLISAVYFFAIPFCQGKPSMIFLSFAPAIWAALRLLEEYFREGGPINSPIRTVNLSMIAFLLLFFAEEIRFGIGNQITGPYLFCLFSAIAFTGNAVFPKIAIIFTKSNNYFSFSFMEWCLAAAIFLFLVARLITAPASLGEYIAPKKKSKSSKESSATDTASVEDDPKTEEITDIDDSDIVE